MITFEQSELHELEELLAAENIDLSADDMTIEDATHLMIDLYQVLRSIAHGLQVE